MAEAILDTALTKVRLVGNESDVAAIRARFENYREFCPSTADRAEELVALVSISCAELFDNDGDDFVFTSSTTMWASGLLKIFEDVMAQTLVTA